MALVLGAWLRLDQLLAQVPADDEWHALRAVHMHDFAWIFTHFGISDYSVPLALYDQVLASTIGIGELGLRLPMLVAGLASIVVFPLLVRPFVGSRAANTFALLIATSPVLVYYSRYARPYAPATLAAFTALIAAWRWREEGGRGWAALFGVSAIAATWLLPVYGPLVLAPWVWLCVESFVRRKHAPHPPGSVLLLGLATGLGLAALLGPPLWNDLGSLTEKMSARRPVTVHTLRQIAELFLGVGEVGPRWVMLGLALVGALVLSLRLPTLMLFLLFAAGVQATALWVANPAMVNSGITLGRYVLPLQPVTLLFIALLLGECDRVLSAGRLSERVPWTGMVLATWLFMVGPLPGVLAQPNAFTNHAWHQYCYSAADRAGIVQYWGRTRKKLPEFFYELAEREPGSVRLVEAPWFYPWSRVKMRESQAVHRQHVTVGFVGRGANPENELPLGDEFRFRTFVDVGDHDEIVRRGFDYVVFHNDLTRELKKAAGLIHIQLGTHLEEYTERFGPPVYADKRLTVFAVR